MQKVAKSQNSPTEDGDGGKKSNMEIAEALREKANVARIEHSISFSSFSVWVNLRLQKSFARENESSFPKIFFLNFISAPVFRRVSFWGGGEKNGEKWRKCSVR